MAGTTPALGWGHINVNVTDLDRAIAFYELLGFSVVIPGIPYLGLGLEPATLAGDVAAALGVPDGTTGRACILQLDDGFPKLDLTEFRAAGGRTPLTSADTGIVRICLASSDLAADHARLAAAGVEFISSPTSGHEGLADIAICRDPDGTLIELIQLHFERWGPYLAG